MDVLRELRESARLTQRELSLKIKRSHSYIHRVEIGERTLDYLEAFDVCEALGVDPFELLDRVLNYDKPPPKIEPIVVSAAEPTSKKTKPKPKPKKKR